MNISSIRGSHCTICSSKHIFIHCTVETFLNFKLWINIWSGTNTINCLGLFLIIIIFKPWCSSIKFFIISSHIMTFSQLCTRPWFLADFFISQPISLIWKESDMTSSSWWIIIAFIEPPEVFLQRSLRIERRFGLVSALDHFATYNLLVLFWNFAFFVFKRW